MGEGVKLCFVAGLVDEFSGAWSFPKYLATPLGVFFALFCPAGVGGLFVLSYFRDVAAGSSEPARVCVALVPHRRASPRGFAHELAWQKRFLFWTFLVLSSVL